MLQDTFISSYLKHTEIYESPLSFWKWSAYATVAALLKDHCYLRSGDSYLFPNMYVLFLAESSGHRKGRPVELSETLINKANNTKIISGRASVEAILDELARSETDASTGKVIKSSSAIFYAPELSAGIVANPDGLKILTDIYDYKLNPYRSRLRTGPCFNLERIVFSMLAASNNSMLKDMFDKSVTEGGMLARTFLVTPNEFRPSNDLLDVDAEERKKSLATVFSNLQKMQSLHGEFKLTNEAKQEYKSWYDPFRQSYSKRKERSGITGRIHTSALKLAMILTANDLTLCIQKSHMEQAINECLGLLPNYGSFLMSYNENDAGRAGGIVLTSLLEAKEYTLTRKELMRDNWQYMDADLLDKVLVTLEQAGMVTSIQSKGEFAIKLTQTCLEMMQQKVQKK